jgi:biopolymer transport protein ExbB/TolQ
MDPTTPLMVEHLRYVLWAIPLGLLAGFLPVIVLLWWLQHREFKRLRQEQREWQRLQQIRDQLWLESLSEQERERILEHRRLDAERERRAQELLRHEREAQRNGHAR